MQSLPEKNHTDKRFHSPFNTALALEAAGIGCLPLRLDGTKAPALRAGHPYLQRRPTIEEIEGWFAPRPETGRPPRRGIGIVAGQASGGLEGIDLDDLDVIRPYLDRVEGIAPGLLDRLVWIITPRPGLQLIYRCPVIGRNQVLASREIPATEEQIASRAAYEREPRTGDYVVRRARIETRGEGGYFVAVGSPAAVHRNRTPYRFYPGHRDYSEVQTISEAEREVLFDLARSFCALPQPAASATRPLPRIEARGPLLPGDDFNLRGDVRGLLIHHGWRPRGTTRAGESWTRPGKDPRDGASATLFINQDIPLFYVHTSSSQLKPHTTYTPFALITTLEYCGDFGRTTRELAQAGYGEEGKR